MVIVLLLALLAAIYWIALVVGQILVWCNSERERRVSNSVAYWVTIICLCIDCGFHDATILWVLGPLTFGIVLLFA